MKKLVSILIIAMLLLTAFMMPTGATLIDYLYGDMNKDGSVDVLDATEIMRNCAKVVEFQGMDYKLADFDNDKVITVMDATSIQMYNAKLIKSPRFNEYLEYYVEIEDIDIKTYTGIPLIEDKSIKFDIVFDEVYNVADDGEVCYDYTFRGITDETYLQTEPHEFVSYPTTSWSFPEPGIYEVEVKVYKQYLSGVYTFKKQFEVFKGFEFDGLRFVDYDNTDSIYVKPPESATELDYQTVVNSKAMDLKGGYGASGRSMRFVALIHTKEEYDKLFEIDNTEFDDAFFEDKSLVVAVSLGNEWHDYYPIDAIKINEDVLYVDVSYRNNSPYEGIELPAAPMWYSFAAVDKADVENITAVHRY